MGTISADARQAVPDPGVVIHELTGAMFNGGGTPGPKGPPPCDCGDSDGDPVSLYTGQFDHTEHDLWVRDIVPIDISRTYDSLDLNQRDFGLGMSNPYNVFFFSQNQFQEVDLILPNGTRVHYVRTSPGNNTFDAVLESTAPGPWSHSVITASTTRVGWDLRFRDGRVWFFPQLNPLAEMTDANGNVTRIVRESAGGTQGKILRIVSPNGRTVDFTYTGTKISGATDNIGRHVTYNYDASSRLTSVVDPMGGTRTYAWDANNRISAIHDAAGRLVVQNQYGGDGRLSGQTLADGSTYIYGYVLQNGLTTQAIVNDRRGHIRSVFFDQTGYVVQDIFPDGGPDQQVTNFENSGGKLTARIDALGRRTEYQYDANGNMTRVTRLAGTSGAVSSTITYDPALNVPLVITDANGHISTYSYDASGNLTNVADALGHVTSFTSDIFGRPIASMDPLGRVTSRAYDGADLASVTDPLGRQTQYVTDAAGRRTAIIDPLGNRTLLQRDDLDRLTRATDALGSVTTFTYDPDGHLLTYTDANGHTAGYEYNSIAKVRSFWDALSKWETRQYEVGGRVSQFIDRKGQLRSVTYDALGRVKTVSYGASQAHPTAYQSVVENTWDAGNRLIQIVDKTCADPVGSPNCASVASTRTITRTYDGLDRLISEVTPQAEVDYTYDSAGRRTSMIIKNGPPAAQFAQPAITYSYDAADRLTAIHQAAGSINGGVPQDIAFAYDAAGQRTQVTFPNGATAAYAYDLSSQLTSITYKRADGSLIGDLQYSYDAASQLTDVSGTLARLNLPATDTTDAAYDANNRLVTWAGKTYAYDDNGNLVDDGTNAFEWNERNRLTRITRAGTELASFQYDSVGRRTAKTIGSLTSGFVYDHKNVVQELQGATSADAVTAHLLTAGTDQLFLRIEGNDGANLRSVLSDGNHNTLMLLDAAQQVVVNYAYEPYGAATADASTANSQQFTARDNDNPGIDQGLYYYRARYYVPGIARFISEDPIGWSSGQPNNYAYVAGDPINFRDPLGHDAADNFESFSAGFGDAITFGLTRWIRKGLGIDGVNTCSGWYTGGEIVGVVALTVATAGVATEAEAGADAAEALAEEEAAAEGAAADGAEQAPKAFEKLLKEAQRELRQNKDFRRWFHREFKPGELASDGTSTNLDLTEEQLVDAFQEWIELGKPTVK
jgi:RHS repeat-associated protein